MKALRTFLIIILAIYLFHLIGTPMHEAAEAERVPHNTPSGCPQRVCGDPNPYITYDDYLDSIGEELP